MFGVSPLTGRKNSAEKNYPEYKTDIARLAEYMEKLDADAAKQESRFLLAVFGMVALATAILGFLIRLPAAS